MAASAVRIERPRYVPASGGVAATGPAAEPVEILINKVKFFMEKHQQEIALYARFLSQRLQEQGIGNAIHYPIPIHRTGAYAELGYRPGSLPVAERLRDLIEREAPPSAKASIPGGGRKELRA